ncbi:MAG: hypothetical protein U9Q04_03020 [Campylobacterota bacterium]|nr:hypothetical protein [Campylobacterota bacterium]
MRTLILIAVSSGTASLALKGANFNFDSVINVMFTLGILLSIFILILLTIYDYQIKNLTKKLEW